MQNEIMVIKTAKVDVKSILGALDVRFGEKLIVKYRSYNYKKSSLFFSEIELTQLKNIAIIF